MLILQITFSILAPFNGHSPEEEEHTLEISANQALKPFVEVVL